MESDFKHEGSFGEISGCYLRCHVCNLDFVWRSKLSGISEPLFCPKCGETKKTNWLEMLGWFVYGIVGHRIRAVVREERCPRGHACNHMVLKFQALSLQENMGEPVQGLRDLDPFEALALLQNYAVPKDSETALESVQFQDSKISVRAVYTGCAALDMGRSGHSRYVDVRYTLAHICGIDIDALLEKK